MSETATLEAPVQEAAPDPAAILAKQGTFSSVSSSMVDTPEPIKEKVEPEKKQEPVKVEATAPTPAAEVKPTQSSPEETKAPVQAAEVNWKEVLKKQPEQEVLKELGLDEKMVGLLNTWKGGGDVNRYLREATTDYSKMTGEQLMRHQLKQDNLEMTDEDFEELYQAKVIDAYKLDANMYEEKDVKRGRIILNADTKKIREGLIAAQKQFILDSKPPEAKLDPAIAAKAEAEKQYLENYDKEIKGSDIYKSITNEKIFPLEIEGQKYKLEIADPAKIESAIFDVRVWNQLLKTSDGKQDTEKQFLLSAIANDHKAVLSSLAKFFIGVGKNQAIAPIENLKSPDEQVSKPEAVLTGAAALAKHGMISG